MAEKSIYSISKFSKSALGSQASNRPHELDWQHHTQPILRVLLECQRSPHGAPTSARLRVVWTVDGLGGQMKTAQENIILEDMDMMLIRQHVHPFPLQGLPLKAVYRDNLVGIRYLPVHARANLPSEYRRFQMTFQTTTAATEFVEKISAICPCKLSPTSAAALGPSTQVPHAHTKVPMIAGQESHGGVPPELLAESQALSLPTAGQSMYQQPMAPMRIQRPGYTTPQCSDDNIFPSSQASATMSSLPAEFSLPLRPQTAMTLRPQPQAITQTNLRLSTNDISVTQPPSVYNLERSSVVGPTSDKQELSFPPFNQEISANTNGLARSRTIAASFESSVVDTTEHRPEIHPSAKPGYNTQEPHLPATGDIHESQTSVPSALPAKTKKPAGPVPLQGGPETPSRSSDPLIESLYEACNLDHLPPDELEKLIAHVIREDGFSQLLEKLDNSWRLKGLVSI